MDHDEHFDHFGEQYDEHYVDEQGYPEHGDHLHDAEVFHDADAHHDGEDDAYDPDAHDDAQTLDFEPSQCHESIDYEPPSPSYPYPEDQQPPDSEITMESLGDPGKPNKVPRHVSEIYASDAVSGTELDHNNSIISEYLRSKDRDWDHVTKRTEPLNLLELPVDVLRLIVKEVRRTLRPTHTEYSPPCFSAC